MSIRTFYLANPPQKGKGVELLQTALRAAKLYNGTVNGIFNQGTAQACKRAKFRLGYPPNAVVPTGGAKLLQFLRGEKELPHSYKVRRRKRGFGISKEQKIREAIVSHALWGVQNEPRIHYTQSTKRDDALKQKPRPLPLYTDCSGFDTLCYKWGGGPDPNGFDFRIMGYTGTMLDNGVTISVTEAEIADLVILGNFPGTHVAMIVKMDSPSNPLLVSHGRESGPNYVRLSDYRKPYVIKRYIGI